MRCLFRKTGLSKQVEKLYQARLAQSVERQALNLVVGGSSPPVGDSIFIAFRLFEHGDGMSSSSFEWC